jgi:hypothetical protein
MTHAIVNSIGLLLGIIGTRLIWLYGLPASIDRRGQVGRITDDVDEEQIRKGKAYDFKSHLGFRLLVGSFVVQLVSNFIPC